MKKNTTLCNPQCTSPVAVYYKMTDFSCRNIALLCKEIVNFFFDVKVETKFCYILLDVKGEI